MAFLLSSWVNGLPFKDKVRIETFQSWINSLVTFDFKAFVALNHEELNSIQEEKQIFLNEIGYDEKLLRNFYRKSVDVWDRVASQTTEEGIQFVFWHIGDRFLCDNPRFRIDVLLTALDNYIKKKQKYTAPAA